MQLTMKDSSWKRDLTDVSFSIFGQQILKWTMTESAYESEVENSI